MIMINNKYMKGLEMGFSCIKAISLLEDDPAIYARMRASFIDRYRRYRNETAPVRDFRQEAVLIVEELADEMRIIKYGEPYKEYLKDQGVKMRG